MLVSPPLMALFKVLLSIPAVLTGTPTSAPRPVPGFSPVPVPSPGTGPGARSVPSLPVPATTSAPLPFLRPKKPKLDLCSGFPPQARRAAKTFPQTHKAPTDGRCPSACPACQHWASELPVLSGHQLPLSHRLHPAYSARTKN